MLDDLHYYSKALKRISLALIAATVLSGCSVTSPDTSTFSTDGKRDLFGKTQKATEIDEVISGSTQSYVEPKDTKSSEKVGLVASQHAKKAIEPFKIDTTQFSRAVLEKNSAACRYLQNNAEAEAAIIGSPTLSASSDEDGSGSVSVGMNLLDFKKAELVRASGDAKCRLHESSKKIEATLGLGAEATKFARSWAKQDHIRRNLGTLNAIRARANGLMEQGIITVQDTNRIAQSIAELKSTMELSRAEANQRGSLPALSAGRIKSSHGSLIEATNDLQNIEREIRTNDALELSVSAGYRYNDTFNDTLQQSETGGTFARVSVGIRLGALSAQRRQAEDNATGARLDALLEENTGAIWKSGFSDRTIAQMMGNLEKSERELATALAKTKQTISNLSGEENPDVVRMMLASKIEKVRIGSELAAIRAAIKQLRTNRGNIQALSQ